MLRRALQLFPSQTLLLPSCCCCCSCCCRYGLCTTSKANTTSTEAFNAWYNEASASTDTFWGTCALGKSYKQQQDYSYSKCMGLNVIDPTTGYLLGLLGESVLLLLRKLNLTLHVLLRYVREGMYWREGGRTEAYPGGTAKLCSELLLQSSLPPLMTFPPPLHPIQVLS